MEGDEGAAGGVVQGFPGRIEGHQQGGLVGYRQPCGGVLALCKPVMML